MVLALENSTSHYFIKEVSLKEWNPKTKSDEYNIRTNRMLEYCLVQESKISGQLMTMDYS